MNLKDILVSYHLSESLLLSLAAVGLGLCVAIDQAQLLAKLDGVRRLKIAGGYNAAMKIMVLNRFGTVLFFLFSALAIDTGTPSSRMSAFFSGSIFGIVLLDLIIAALLWRRMGFTLNAVRTSGVRPGPVVAALFATMFGLLGLTLPMLMSAAYPSLRLTLANTGFLFNSVFTIISVFFIESYFARIVDENHGFEKASLFVTLIFLMRLLAAIATCALLVVLSRMEAPSVAALPPAAAFTRP